MTAVMSSSPNHCITRPCPGGQVQVVR